MLRILFLVRIFISFYQSVSFWIILFSYTVNSVEPLLVNNFYSFNKSKYPLSLKSLAKDSPKFEENSWSFEDRIRESTVVPLIKDHFFNLSTLQNLLYSDRQRDKFSNAVETKSLDTSLSENRAMLRSMLMTASDLSGITKPWDIQKRVCSSLFVPFSYQPLTELNLKSL